MRTLLLIVCLSAACGDSELTELPLESAVSVGAVEFAGDHWTALQPGAQIWLELDAPEGMQFDFVELEHTPAGAAPARVTVGLQSWTTHWARARLELDEPMRVGADKPLVSWSSAAAGDTLRAVRVALY